MEQQSSLSRNSIAFIGLCNEYCMAVERASEYEPTDFIKEMLRLLPRIYISASDIESDIIAEENDIFIDDSLNETQYNAFRSTLSAIFGENDTFLEVFEEDMKYSDTPIAASISEGLADLMQVFYNFIAAVKDAPTELIPAIIASVKEDFNNYWSQVLCNVMRPLNQIYYNDSQI